MEGYNYNKENRPQGGEIKAYEGKYFKEKIGDIKVYFSNWNDLPKALIEKVNQIKRTSNYLDYEKAQKQDELWEQGILSGGDKTYVFSQTNKQDKYSDNYLDCTGLLIAGKRKKDKEKISFITHQDPKFFIENKENKKHFKNKLNEKLASFLEECDLEAINPIIFGGNLLEDKREDVFDENFVLGRDDVEDVDKYFPDKYRTYLDSVNFLDFVISEKTKIHPKVALGPNDNWESASNFYGENRHALSAYFDNKEMKLYLIGPTRIYPESFSADEIYQKTEEYKNGEK